MVPLQPLGRRGWTTAVLTIGAVVCWLLSVWLCATWVPGSDQSWPVIVVMCLAGASAVFLFFGPIGASVRLARGKPWALVLIRGVWMVVAGLVLLVVGVPVSGVFVSTGPAKIPLWLLVPVVVTAAIVCAGSLTFVLNDLVSSLWNAGSRVVARFRHKPRS